jgi:hypothetical protein
MIRNLYEDVLNEWLITVVKPEQARAVLRWPSHREGRDGPIRITKRTRVRRKSGLIAVMQIGT